MVVDALAGLEVGPALDGAAARLLRSLPPGEAAEALDDLVSGTAGAREQKALIALCRAIHFGDPPLGDEPRQLILRSARSLGFGAVTSLFTRAGAERVIARADTPERIERKQGTSTLGHRTQTARAERNRDRLVRLALDPDPAVIRNLLLNPRVTEALVLRIASRRPVDGEVLETVARSEKWSKRPAVRRALAQNPYAPPSLANSLLPTLNLTELGELATSPTVHPAVRNAAKALVAARRGE